MDIILIAESEIGEQGYLYLVYLLEVPLHKVCIIREKEQLVNDSEGFVMMYDEREDKCAKNKNIFFSLLVIQHLFLNI